jgi:hypothetical protein
MHLSYEEKAAIESARYWLGTEHEGIKAQLDALAKMRSVELTVFDSPLPALADLGENERYMLHHWAVVSKESSTSGKYEIALPIWYVVTPQVGDRHIVGWTVVRKDICPNCAKRILPEHLDEGQYAHSWDDPHHGCRESWTSVEWLKSLKQPNP